MSETRALRGHEPSKFEGEAPEGVELPTCDVADEPITTGAEARCSSRVVGTSSTAFIAPPEWQQGGNETGRDDPRRRPSAKAENPLREPPSRDHPRRPESARAYS